LINEGEEGDGILGGGETSTIRTNQTKGTKNTLGGLDFSNPESYHFIKFSSKERLEMFARLVGEGQKVYVKVSNNPNVPPQKEKLSEVINKSSYDKAGKF